MPAFVGLDLAWTAHRESGICVLTGTGDDIRCELLEASVRTPAEFAALLAGCGADVVAAIDAPLLLGEGRTAEREVGRLFSRYRASAHAANRQLLESTARMAGPHLAARLATEGFSLDPLTLKAWAAGRHAIEVYPHAAHVVLFGLDERIPYKQKRGRNVAFLAKQLAVYQRNLASALAEHLPALLESVAVTALLAPEATTARGAARKRLEDMLDSVTCALLAYLAWDRGLTPGDVLGNADGYVVVPGLRSDPRFA